MMEMIAKQAAIDALKVAYWDKDIQSAKDDPCIVDAMTDWTIRQVKDLPPVQPTLYGYSIEHLALIARVMEAEGISPQEAIRKFENAQYMYELLIDEIQKNLDEAMKSRFCEERKTDG